MVQREKAQWFLLLLSLATGVIIAAAAVVGLLGTPPFQNVIINVFVFVLAVIMIVSDLYRPLFCYAHFSFFRYFWGRVLVYLFLGALIIQQSNFLLFAGVWTWAVAFIFLVMWLLVLCDRNRFSKTGVVEAAIDAPRGDGTTPFKSGR